VARLAHAAENEASRREVRLDGTVLITGGLGALGLHVARWLAQRGVRHLVLTGRRGRETPGIAEAVAELEALGTRVTVAAMDVSELGIIRSRMYEAARSKARRGELRILAPIGYTWDRHVGLSLDPDHRLQEVIRLVFQKFR
jgi:NAD(P)-dependent dehydrogenase (short-subunit alcohol dehydrogenase family)